MKKRGEKKKKPGGSRVLALSSRAAAMVKGEEKKGGEKGKLHPEEVAMKCSDCDAFVPRSDAQGEKRGRKKKKGKGRQKGEGKKKGNVRQRRLRKAPESTTSPIGKEGGGEGSLRNGTRI